MNSNFIGRDNAIFNCSGQWSCFAGNPGYVKSKHLPNMIFRDSTTHQPDSYSSACSYWDLYDEEPESFHGVFPAYSEEEFNDMNELIMLEELFLENQDLSRMRLTHNAQDATDDSSFLEKLLWKQHLLRQCLNEKNDRWGLRSITQLSEKDDLLSAQPAKNESSNMFVLRKSMGQTSEQGSTMECQTQSDSSWASQPEEPPRKSRHCRHFLKGYCERGDSCGFRHDQSVFCTNMQKVFLGGLPPHLTPSLLRKRLTEQGYTVLNNPKICRWFSPQVCLGSVEEAQRLVEKQTIIIDKANVRVRPFEAYTKDSKKKSPDEVERSIFLGGLSAGTTLAMIQEELDKIGMVVVNNPVLKSGYCRQVVLETFQQARRLLEIKQVQINGTLVNVRSFANI